MNVWLAGLLVTAAWFAVCQQAEDKHQQRRSCWGIQARTQADFEDGAGPAATGRPAPFALAGVAKAAPPPTGATPCGQTSPTPA